MVGDGLCAVHVTLEGELVVGGQTGLFFCSWSIRSWRWSSGGVVGVDNVVDEAGADGKVEAGLVDIDANDVGGALGTNEGTGEEPDGAGAEDEDGGAAGEGCATGGVEDNGEGLGEGSLLVGDARGKGVEPLVGVEHVRLEGAIDMGGGLGRGAETHVGAEVVSTLAAAWTGMGMAAAVVAAVAAVAVAVVAAAAAVVVGA